MDLTDQIGPISAFDILRQRVNTPATLVPISSQQRTIQWSTRILEALKKHWPAQNCITITTAVASFGATLKLTNKGESKS